MSHPEFVIPAAPGNATTTDPRLTHMLSRRRLVLAGAGSLAALLAAGTLRPADASADWCWDDPIVSIDGRIVKVLNGVAAPAATVRQYVTSANVEIRVPAGTPTALISWTSEYFGETVTWKYDRGTYVRGKKVDVAIRVKFTATKTLDVASDITWPNGFKHMQATTDGSMSTQFFLPPL